MKIGNKRMMWIFAVIFVAFLAPTLTLAETKKPDQKILENAENFLWTKKPLLALADAPFLALGKKNFAQGGDIEDIVTDLLFPTSGRAKYVQFIPRFGKNKMYWRKLKWKKYETDHISLFVYDPILRDLFISVVEENYTDLAKTFETATFNEKMLIMIYRDRRDFRQMNFGGIDPDDIGGVTHDLKKWHNKIAFLFEGSKSDLFEVARHEMVHRFNMEQIYHISGKDMVMNPPIWFVEGTAVSYSRGWDAFYEWIARDAYYNGFLEYGIMSEGRGTIMPYVTGGMLLNYIKKNYGTKTVNAIWKDAGQFAGDKMPKPEKFDEILKKYTGSDSWELYGKARSELKNHLVKTAGDIDITSPELAKGIAVDARDNLLLRFEGKYLRTRLQFSVLKNGKIVKSKKIAADGTNKNEELETTGALSATHLAYVTFDSAKGVDVIKVVPYKVSGEKIKLGKTKKYSFPEIVFIQNPEFVGKNKIAFIGLENGFTNIYLFDTATKKLAKLTSGTSYIYGMDYSAERNEIIFSRESDERTTNPNKCDFNYDLFLLNLETKKETKVVETPYDETSPKWLDASRAVFTSDEFGTFNLAIYDFAAQRFISLGSARIAAMRPLPLGAEAILFHTTKELERKILLLETASFASAAPNNAEIDKSPDNAEIGNVVIKDGKLFVKYGSSLYPAARFAFLENDLYFEAVTGPGKSTLFEFNKETLQTTSAPSVKNESVDKFREENEVMREDVSPSGNFAVFAVNNRLKWVNQKMGKNYPASVYIYDIKAGKFTTKFDFAMKSTRGFGSVTLLANEYALLAMGDKIFLLNLATGSIELKTDYLSFKISSDKKLIAWQNKANPGALKSAKAVFVFDTASGKQIKLGEYKKMQNFGFNADNELVWSEETGKRWTNLALHIYIWNPQLEKPMDITINISKKSVLSTGKKSVSDFKASSVVGAVLLMHNDTSGKNELYLAKPAKEKIATLSKIDLQNLSGIILQALYKNHLFFAVIKNKKTRFYAYDVSSGALSERIKPWNAATNGSQIIISGKKSIAIYNAKKSAGKIIANAAGYHLKENKLLYSKWADGSNYDIFEDDLDTGETLNLTQTPHRDEVKPYYKNNKINYSVTPVYKGESVAYVSPPPPPKYSEGRVKKVKAKTKPFDVATGMGFGSVGSNGGRFSIFGHLNIHLYDIFEDNVMELYYFGGYNLGFNYAEISYLHRPSGNGIRAYFNNYAHDYLTGADYMRTFQINKFQRVTLGVGYKNQLLLNQSPSDYRGWSNVLNMGVSYTLDTTRRMLHGPQTGFRLFASLNLGNNLDHNTLNNIDLNFAWRHYLNICDLASFAYRLETGASLGIAPTWFGMGGNMAMRGLPTASLWGNIYALGSAEIRLDIIYYAGAILKEPLTTASVFFVAIMPQFGWYVDLGTAFYWNPLLDHPHHDEEEDATLRHILEDLRYPPELYWSTGPFINLPYLPLGMILRFNWSVAGPYKGWNFWFGFNW